MTVRLVYARARDTLIRVSWSTILSMRYFQDMSPRLAVALMRSLAQAVYDVERSAASRELLEYLESACKDWEVTAND